MNYKTLLVLMFSILAFSCGETTPTLLDPGDEKEITEAPELHDDYDLPDELTWRPEIAVFSFQPEEAVDWNYETEGVIVIPSEEDEKVAGMKPGDVLVVFESYIFFVDTLATTDSGTEVSVRRFVVAEAIYGEFDLPLLGEQDEAGIGNFTQPPSLSLTLPKFGQEFVTGKFAGSVADAGIKFPFEVDPGSFKAKIPHYGEDYDCQGETLGGYCVDYMLVKLTLAFDAHFDATLKASIEAEIASGLKDDLATFPAIDSWNSNAPRIALGNSGLAFKPQLEIPAVMKITASGQFEIKYETEMEGRYPVGFEFTNEGYEGRSLDFDWLPSTRHPASFTNDQSWDGGTDGLSGKVVMHSHLGVGLGFRIVPVVSSSVGISGLGFSGQINADLTLDPFKANNCLQAEYSVSVHAKAKIRFFIDHWGPGEWEWELFGQTGSVKNEDGATKRSIKVWSKSLSKTNLGSLFCIDEEAASQLRISVVNGNDPPGLEDRTGYEVDGVQVTRLVAGPNIVPQMRTWEANSASGGANSDAATGKPDATTCSGFDDKVAGVSTSITLGFPHGFEDGDTVNVFQYLPGNEIGQNGACYGSGTIKIEVGDGSNWNTVTESIAGNAVVTIEGKHLIF